MTKIFESPDKGKTVYSREAGDTARELVKDTRTHDGRPLLEHLKEAKLWGNIHRAALTNPALQIALDHVKVTYALTKDYEEKYGRRKT